MPQALKKFAKNVPYEMQVKFRPASEAELKAIGENLPEGYIAGWASTPDLDSYHHVVKAGAFDEAIKSRGLKGPKGIKLLLGHDWDKVAGQITVLEMRNGSLWIEAQLNLKVSYVQDAYQVMLMNDGWSFSVGFMLQDYEFKENEQGHEYLHILRGDLYEVSTTPFPANEECTMTFIKSKLEVPEKVELKRVSDFEKMLMDDFGITSQQNAHKITLAVKSNLHLFGKASVSDPASEPTTPLMPEGANDLRKALANLKKTLQDS